MRTHVHAVEGRRESESSGVSELTDGRPEHGVTKEFESVVRDIKLTASVSAMDSRGGVKGPL